MKFPKAIPILLFLFVFITGILAAPHIGTAWDEPDNIFSAGVYYNFFRKGFNQSILTSKGPDASYWNERIFTQEPSLARYPPVPNYVGMAFALVGERIGFIHNSRGVLEAFHIASGAFFGILVASMFAWGILIGLSVHTSILVAAATFLTPTLFGYGFSNIKDIAQVALFSVSLYTLAYGSLTKRPTWHVYGGILWGLALASKFNAVYVPLIWGLWQAVRLIHEKVRERKTKRLIPELLGSSSVVVFQLLTIVCIGLVTTFIVWPYLWIDPFGKLASVVEYFTTVGRGYRIYWDGVYYVVGAGESLWWYPLANFFLVTPIPILVTGLIGLFVSAVSLLGFLMRRRIVPLPVSGGMGALVLFWLFFPVFRIVLPSAAFYDGIRHFLEILPAFILLAGVGAEFLARWLAVVLSKRISLQVPLMAAASLVFLLYLANINGSYFPYSTGYYNGLAVRPNTRFDRDLTGLAIREGLDYLHQHYEAVNVWAPISGHQSWYYLRPQDNYVYTKEHADAIILINKRSHVTQEDFEQTLTDHVLDYTIVRGDAVFGWVYRKNNF